MQCSGQLRVSLKQAIKSIGRSADWHTTPSGLTLHWQGDVGRRAHSIASGEVPTQDGGLESTFSRSSKPTLRRATFKNGKQRSKQSTPERRERRDSTQRKRPAARRVAFNSEKQQSTEPTSERRRWAVVRKHSTYDVPHITDDALRRVGRPVVRKHLGDKGARLVDDVTSSPQYISVHTPANSSRVEKELELSQAHTERQAGMLVQDILPTLRLLEDAPCSFVTHEKDPNAEKARGQDLQELQDVMDYAELEDLEDALDDITYAPSRRPISTQQAFDRVPEVSVEETLNRRPRTFSARSLAAYVNDLTEATKQFNPPRPDGSEHPTSNQRHIKDISRELILLLTNDQVTPCITSATLSRCLSFFIRFRQYNAVRQVYAHLKNVEYNSTVVDFDELLLAAANEESARYFHSTLVDMLGSGLSPSVRTWSTFYTLVCRKFTPRISHVVRAMRRKGVLSDPVIVQQVVTEAVITQLDAHLAKGGHLETFLRRLESLYGDRSRWLGVPLGNRICRILLHKNRDTEALDTVKQVQKHAAKMSRAYVPASTVNTFLYSTLPPHPARAQHNLVSAIANLRRLSNSIPRRSSDGSYAAIELNSLSFSILFRLGCQCRGLNILRTIWRYACMKGQVRRNVLRYMTNSLKWQAEYRLLFSRTTQRQRLRGSRSLKEQVRDDATAIGNRILVKRSWNVWAATFAVNIREGLSRNTSPPGASASDSTGTNEDAQFPSPLQRFKIERHTPRASPRRLKTMLEHDLKAAGSLRPTNDFVGSLELAWQRDLAWKKQRLGTRDLIDEQVFEKILEDGVEVPVEMINEGRPQVRFFHSESTWGCEEISSQG